MSIRLNNLLCKNKKEIEVNEEDIIAMMDKKIQEKTHGKAMEDMNLDELDELEDEVSKYFSNCSCMFLNPNIFFSYLNYNCFNVLDMRNL